VVWLQDDGTGIDSIYANRYVAGSGWGTAGLIEGGSGEVGEPQIALDGSGNAIVVWDQDDGTGVGSIYANRYVAGSGWGTATAIESDDINVGRPMIAVNGSGHAVAVWPESEGANYSFHANRYTAGSGWGTATNIGIVTGEVTRYKIAMDKDGNAIAVWSQSDGTANNIYTNYYVPETGWGTAKTLENEPYDAWSPEIAFDGYGDAIAVWTQSDGTAIRVWAKQYSLGFWEAGKTNIESDPHDCYGPKIAINKSGDTVVVWQTYPSVILWSNSYTLGSWEASKEIASGTVLNGRQEVAINNNGDAVVVWAHGTGIEQTQIWANFYR